MAYLDNHNQIFLCLCGCWDVNIRGDPGADSGGEGKSKRAGKYGTKKSKERREELFSPFFTFLRATFFRPFRLSLDPTICPWVSEDEIWMMQQNLTRGSTEQGTKIGKQTKQ